MVIFGVRCVKRLITRKNERREPLRQDQELEVAVDGSWERVLKVSRKLDECKSEGPRLHWCFVFQAGGKLPLREATMHRNESFLR